MQANRYGVVLVALAAALLGPGCVAPPAAVRAGTPPLIDGALIEPDAGPPEIALRSSPAWRAGAGVGAMPRGDATVEAAAHRALLDLRQAASGATPSRTSLPPVDVLRRDLERLRLHIAAAWQFDADVADATFMRVRLRAMIAPDGTVRAIEFLDSHGESQDALARFVADAIATLDGSSPLPLAGPPEETRALVFRFEAGRARQ